MILSAANAGLGRHTRQEKGSLWEVGEEAGRDLSPLPCSLPPCLLCVKIYPCTCLPFQSHWTLPYRKIRGERKTSLSLHTDQIPSDSLSLSLYECKVVVSLCTWTHMTQHIWQSESGLGFPRGERERKSGEGEREEWRSGAGGGFWSGAPRRLEFPACQGWWIWLKIKESGGPVTGVWMNERGNELRCSFTPDPVRKTHTTR